MGELPRRPWVGVMILAGAGYLVIGQVFSALDDSPVPSTVRMWRLAAWLASAAVYAAHIGYEHARLGNSPRSIGLHTATAVAVGAFALAVAGMVHSLLTTSHTQLLWLLALVVWPMVTAVPAFLVALVAGALLTKLSRRA